MTTLLLEHSILKSTSFNLLNASANFEAAFPASFAAFAAASNAFVSESKNPAALSALTPVDDANVLIASEITLLIHD